MSSINYAPEEFGVRLIDQFDLSDGCYKFDYVTVWQSLTDKRVFYIDTDSGCSCPSPHEYISDIAEVERLDPDNPRPRIEALFRIDQPNSYWSAADLMKGVAEMEAKVMEAQR